MSPNLSPASSCPEHVQLLGLAEGTLSEAEATSISEHVAHCQACDQRLGAIEEQSDDLVRALAMLPASAEDEETFQTLQAQLLAQPEQFGVQEVEATTEALLGRFSPADIPSANVPPTLSLPIQLGNYELLEQIGAGANGAVFRARHRRLEKQVAVKLLLNVAGPAVEEFLHEMRVIGQLDHPNIIEATDAGEHDGIYFLVMEYVPGLDVSSLLRRLGPLSVADACEVARQAALGLSVAHRNHLVHRDVKTSNLLFTSSGQVKLLDLGLATIVARPNDSAFHSQTSGPRGTADYMAPEQWRESGQVTAKADIYSLGCTLFKLLAGEPPFRPLPSGIATLEEAHLHGEIPAISARSKERIPSALEAYVFRLLSKHPEDRPASAEEVATTLSKYATGANLYHLARQVFPEAVVPDPPKPPVTTARTRTRRAALVAGAVTLGAIAWQMRRPHANPRPMASHEWRPLAAATPPIIPLLYTTTERDETSRPELTDRGNQLEVASTRPVLVHFGKPITGVFRYRVQLSRDSWETSAGIFFRLQSEPGGGYHFHTLEVTEADSIMAITWNEYSSHITQPVALAGHDLPRFSSSTAEFEIGLGQFGFPEFVVNGQRMPQSQWTISKEGRELITAHSGQIPATYMGHIGVFHTSGSTRIESPQLMYV